MLLLQHPAFQISYSSMAAAATVEYHPESPAKLKVSGGEAIMDAAEDIVFGSVSYLLATWILY